MDECECSLRAFTTGEAPSLDLDFLVLPEVLEPVRRHFRVPHGMLNVLVAEVCLQRSGIVATIGECKAASMAQHMSVRLDLEACNRCKTFDHTAEACRREWRTTLRDEHKWRSVGLALQLAQRAHFDTVQRMRAGCAVLDPAHVEDGS